MLEHKFTENLAAVPSSANVTSGIAVQGLRRETELEGTVALAQLLADGWLPVQHLTTTRAMYQWFLEYNPSVPATPLYMAQHLREELLLVHHPKGMPLLTASAHLSLMRSVYKGAVVFGLIGIACMLPLVSKQSASLSRSRMLRLASLSTSYTCHVYPCWLCELTALCMMT